MLSRSTAAPLCAAVSSTAAGLTTFGDAILFHICSTLIRASGLSTPATSEDDELRFSVLCTTIMSAVALPTVLLFARRELPRCAPYGLTMAVTGLSMVPVGSALLFHGDLGPVQVATGVFFAIFAANHLTQSCRADARARLRCGETAPLEGAEDPLPPLPAPTPLVF